MPTMPTVQALAKKARSYFKIHKRGETEIWTMKDERPAWVQDLAYAAHGEMGPDDWKFQFVVDALDHIEEQGETEDPPNFEPDIYTGELLAWLASNLTRPGYVDDAVKDYGHSDMGIVGDIGFGQVKEKEEVYYSVLQSLREQAEK